MGNIPVIRRREAVVLELMQKGIHPQVIAKQQGYNETRIYRILRRLKEAHLLDHGGRGVYHVRAGAYEIEDHLTATPHSKRGGRNEPIEPFTHVNLSSVEKEYLKGVHEQLKRSEIALKLGKPRYVICREAISLGIARD